MGEVTLSFEQRIFILKCHWTFFYGRNGRQFPHSFPSNPRILSFSWSPLMFVCKCLFMFLTWRARASQSSHCLIFNHLIKSFWSREFSQEAACWCEEMHKHDSGDWDKIRGSRAKITTVIEQMRLRDTPGSRAAGRLFGVYVKWMCFNSIFPPFLSFSSNEWWMMVRMPLTTEREEKTRKYWNYPSLNFVPNKVITMLIQITRIFTVFPSLLDMC